MNVAEAALPADAGAEREGRARRPVVGPRSGRAALLRPPRSSRAKPLRFEADAELDRGEPARLGHGGDGFTRATGALTRVRVKSSARRARADARPASCAARRGVEVEQRAAPLRSPRPPREAVAHGAFEQLADAAHHRVPEARLVGVSREPFDAANERDERRDAFRRRRRASARRPTCRGGGSCARSPRARGRKRVTSPRARAARSPA